MPKRAGERDADHRDDRDDDDNDLLDDPGDDDEGDEDEQDEGEGTQRRPQKKQAKNRRQAKADDDEDEDDGEDEEDEEDDGSDQEVMTRAGMRKVLKSRSEAKKKYRDLLVKYNDLKSKNETAEERIERETREAVLAEQAEKYKPVLVRKEATALLLDAKLKGGKKRVNKIIDLMDLDEIDVDDEGDVDGLEDEVERIIEEYPELFGKSASQNNDDEDEEDEEDRSRQRRRRQTDRRRRQSTGGSRGQDGAGKRGAPKKESMDEMILRGLRGGR